ncbi:MAG: TetR/AcrR family transcriptional regulator [Verrucomicrobiales bacterium]|nr:TetR/AcrR family transcriptional regulator [Verrucomicrobiales bacterium]
MSVVVASDTKEAILDAAEAVFAEMGFARASIRQIVAAAGVNLAAIHYHFGSKDALIEAVFTRCIGPINARRLELLEALEAEHAKGPLPVAAVMEAFLEPMQEMRESKAKGARMARLYGRLVGESTEALHRMLSRQFGNVVKRFSAALKRSLPAVSEDDLMWRFYFTVGAAAHLMMDPPGLKKLSRGRCDPDEVDVALQQLVRFASAGMAAPSGDGKGERT